MDNNNRNDNQSEEADNDEIIQFLSDMVKEYLKLELEISTLRKEMNKRQDKKKKIEETIIGYIEKTDITYFDLDGNFKGKKMIHKTGEQRGGLTPDNIEKIVREFLDDPQKSEELLKRLDETRTVKKVSKLSIIKPSARKIDDKISKMKELLDEN